MKPEANALLHQPSLFEHRQVYAGRGETLRSYLKNRLQPWRHEIMLSTGAIRVDRGFLQRKNFKLDDKLTTGDIVVIDDAFGETWMKLRREATDKFVDYVFCPQRRDLFLSNQVEALLMGGRVREVPRLLGSTPIPHLYALVANLIPLAESPIRHLVFVTHADGFGHLLLPMRTPDDNNDFWANIISWEGLQEALQSGDENPLFIHDTNSQVGGKKRQERRFSKVHPRPERNDGKFVPFAIIIRGCTTGKHTILLNKIRDAFGYMVDIVVMPKMYDATWNLRAGARPGMVEYFQHDYHITSKTPLNREQIIKAFQKAKLTDWLGNAVPKDAWEDLIPDDVRSTRQSGARKGKKTIPVEVSGHDRTVQMPTFFESSYFGFDPVEMTQEKKPESDEIQTRLLSDFARSGRLNNGPNDWPMWLRIGLNSRQEFADYFDYHIAKGYPKRKGSYWVEGVRYTYLVRTPLIENGVLVADFHPRARGRESTRLINYDDDRIFGRSEPREKDERFPKVGENFSRSLSDK